MTMANNLEQTGRFGIDDSARQGLVYDYIDLMQKDHGGKQREQSSSASSGTGLLPELSVGSFASRADDRPSYTCCAGESTPTPASTFSKPAAEAAIKRLGSGDAVQMQAAARQLQTMGEQAVPYLRDFRAATKDMNAYDLSSKTMQEMLRQYPEIDKVSQFHVPYNKGEAGKAIEGLAHDEPLVRDQSRDKLHAMGPDAIPDLERAAKSNDPEVSNAAQALVQGIKDRRNVELTQKYTADNVLIAKTLEKAGVTIIRDVNFFVDNQGQVHSIGPTQLYGPIREKLTDEDHRNFEKLIDAGDRLKTDKVYQDLMRQTVKPESLIDLKVAGFTQDSRRIYARALENTRQPDDFARGVSVLTDHLARVPEDGREDRFMIEAAKLGAHENKKFMELFRKAGGDAGKLTNIAEFHYKKP